MHIVEKKISDSIRLHQLLPPPGSAKVLVALSGGADSVALLAALVSLGYECAAAHCNFHLRGEESMRDMRHAADICRQLNVDISIKNFNVDERRQATGESVEMACRELRYKWFADVMDSLGCIAVAVAHNHGDNIETFFLNLMRGTGIAGLTGIHPRNGLIIRPMLGCTRSEIVDYLRWKNLRYITDSTNLQNDFKRNRIRNIILPAIEDAFPGAAASITASISHLSQARSFYQQALEERKTIYIKDNTINLQQLIASEPHAQLLLFEWLRPLGFTSTQAADLLRSASSPGRTFSSASHRIIIGRGKAEITPLAPTASPSEFHIQILPDHTILTPVHLRTTLHPIAEFKVEKNPRVIYLDSSALSNNPVWTLRKWCHGDTISPFGMEGKRKVSDIFTDAHLSLAAKERVWILTRDNEIIWVVGLRASRHFAIGPASRTYLRVEWIS